MLRYSAETIGCHGGNEGGRCHSVSTAPGHDTTVVRAKSEALQARRAGGQREEARNGRVLGQRAAACRGSLAVETGEGGRGIRLVVEMRQFWIGGRIQRPASSTSCYLALALRPFLARRPHAAQTPTPPDGQTGRQTDSWLAGRQACRHASKQMHTEGGEGSGDGCAEAGLALGEALRHGARCSPSRRRRHTGLAPKRD